MLLFGLVPLWLPRGERQPMIVNLLKNGHRHCFTQFWYDGFPVLIIVFVADVLRCGKVACCGDSLHYLLHILGTDMVHNGLVVLLAANFSR